jgi:hypothetical protein
MHIKLVVFSHQQAFRHFVIKDDGIERRIDTLAITIPEPQLAPEIISTVHSENSVPDAAQEKVNAVAVGHDGTERDDGQGNNNQPRNRLANNS